MTPAAEAATKVRKRIGAVGIFMGKAALFVVSMKAAFPLGGERLAGNS
jgi:hypothetical protein